MTSGYTPGTPGVRILLPVVLWTSWRRLGVLAYFSLRWNMTEVLTVSSVLGITGVISSFLLFYILLRMGFSEELIQSMFFAKLVIAGHGTIYNTRIDGWFWQKPYPSWLLFNATFSTRVLGTLIAVYGVFITPIGWEYALWIWAYSLVWFVFNDAVKVATYRFLRSHNELAK